MGANHTAEQVVEMATCVRDCAWPADVAEYMTLIEPMLRGLAERIKADESAVPVAVVDAGEDGLFVEILYGADGSPLKVGDKLFIRPPAQAAQVDGAAALAHFTDYFVRNYPGPNTIIYDPKWHAPKIFRAAQYAIANATTNATTTPPTAEPVAQGEAVAWRWRRHAKDAWHYDQFDSIEDMAAQEMRAKGWDVELLFDRPPAQAVQVDEVESRLAAANALLRLCAGNVSNPLVIAIQNHLQGTAEPVAQGEADLCDCDADKYNKLPHHADCAVLAAQPSAVPPDGWVLVPREATEEMVDRAWGSQHPKSVWELMLAAAPSPGASHA